MEKQLERAEPQASDDAKQPIVQKPESTKRNRRMWVAIAAAALLFFIGVAVGIGANWHSMRNERFGFGARTMPAGAIVERGPRMMDRGVTTNPTDGTTYTRLQGVVTQVNSDNFVIAGNGTTKTIKTTDSTTYSTADKKVKVNDSVVVVGTDSNGTFTATSVHVLNQ